MVKKIAKEKGDLIHIRVGRGMKKKIKELIDSGMFSTEAEIAREGIRHLLIRYKNELEEEKKNAKKK